MNKIENIKYYDIGVFISRYNNYSYFVAIDHNNILEDEESIIEYLLLKQKIIKEEANQIRYIEEVDYKTYDQFNK